MRFVNPETVRLYLKAGDWIDVKKELTVGEEKRYRSAGFRGLSQRTDGSEIQVDWAALALARVEAYLVDWSEKRPVSREAIEDLCQGDFEEIDTLVQAHIEAMAGEKKDPTARPSSI